MGVKQTEALKLALEALEQHGCPWIRHEKPYNAAITAIREALAEQPAQQEVEWEKLYRLEVKKKEALAAKYERDTGQKLTRIIPMAEQPAQQQEPVARSKAYDMIDRFLQNNLNSDEDYAEYSKALDNIYTSPPASKPWVGLTDNEWFDFWDGCEFVDGESVFPEFLEIARAIEAKLREKNA